MKSGRLSFEVQGSGPRRRLLDSAAFGQRFHEARYGHHVSTKVCRVEWDVPDDFVNPSEFSHGKRLVDENHSDRRVLESCTNPFDRMHQDFPARLSQLAR